MGKLVTNFIVVHCCRYTPATISQSNKFRGHVPAAANSRAAFAVAQGIPILSLFSTCAERQEKYVSENYFCRKNDALYFIMLK